MATRTKSGTWKLDLDQVCICLQERLEYNGREKFLAQMKQLQIAVHVMCGGGMLGRFAAEQPADFYIDDRVGRLPYTRQQIYQSVAVLKMYAEILGFNPHRLDQDCRLVMDFHNCGVF